MSVHDDTKSVLRKLASNADVLLEAYFNQQSQVEDIPENKALIDVLKKHNLGWQLDSHQPIRLKRELIKVLDLCTQNHRRRNANAQVSAAWDMLIERVDEIADAQSRHAIDDLQHLLMDAEELAYEFIESLRQAIHDFYHYINTGYAYTQDLTLRIAENDRLLSRARSLNLLLDSFNIQELYQRALLHPQLKRLFTHDLRIAITRCNQDLTQAIAQLRQLLMTLKQHQQRSQLIDTFMYRYSHDPSFEPSLDAVHTLSSAVNNVKPIMLAGYPDIYNPIHELSLSELCPSLSLQLEGKVVAPESIVIEASDETPIDLEAAPVQSNSMALMEIVFSTQERINAMEFYVSMDLANQGVSEELWLLSLINQYSSLNQEELTYLDVEFHEERHVDFPHAYRVYDMTFSYRQPTAA